MARTRKNHQSNPSPSTAGNKQSHKIHHSTSKHNKKSNRSYGRTNEEEEEGVRPEGSSTKINTTLDLGTDEDSSEDDNQATDDGGWQTVSGKRRNRTVEPQVTKSNPPLNQVSPSIQLEPEDVQDEIEFWSNAIFCFVLGANPPWTVIQGFANRLWKGKDMDQISFMPNGIFLIRFKSKEEQQEALKNDSILFDNKPVIIEEWTPTAILTKQEIKKVPIWIKLRNLELKFWGGKSITKIVSGIGKYLGEDRATQDKQFLGFAKIKVEVKLDQHFPTAIEFLDELGQKQIVGVSYDWLPVSCQICKGIGHYQSECRKAKNERKEAPKKCWQPKQLQAEPPPATKETNDNNKANNDNLTNFSTPIPPSPPLREQGLVVSHIIESGLQKDGRDSKTDHIYSPGGVSFIEKLTLSIKKDMIKQTEREDGDTLLYG